VSGAARVGFIAVADEICASTLRKARSIHRAAM
jgi:hypothetical protein